MARAKIKCDEWEPTLWHGIDGCRRRWKVTPEGIAVKGEKKIRRSKHQATLAEDIYTRFGSMIENSAITNRVNRRTIVATLCIESGGKEDAERYEKHLRDYSIGLGQTLTSTAHHVGTMMGFPKMVPIEAEGWRMPNKPLGKRSWSSYDLDEWRGFLSNPRNSILLTAGLHAINCKRFGLKEDPVLLYATYNAGSPRSTSKNPWGLVHVVPALDAFVCFYNDTCALLYEDGID